MQVDNDNNSTSNKFITYSHKNTFFNVQYIKSSALNQRNEESKINNLYYKYYKLIL